MRNESGIGAKKENVVNINKEKSAKGRSDFKK